MPFCVKDKQLVTDDFTVIENKFLISYLPDAPETVAKVYLLGLALAGDESEANTLASMAKRLNLTEDDVVAAYDYWEELGLVQVVNSSPAQIVYLPVRESASMLKKISVNKYAKFTKEMQKVITGRMITVSEYNNYFTFLENTAFEWEALVAVAKYCVEHKGADIGYPYILTVANSQLKKGATTAESVVDNLSAHGKFDDDLRLVFKALGTTKKIEYADREMMEKWTTSFGFATDVIVKTAKKIKSGGMKKLDASLEEYFRAGAADEKEIDAYVEAKEKYFETAKTVCKNLGLYYQSLDVVVEEYVVKWDRMGFDPQTLATLAKYCFKNNVRTLSGLDETATKFYKLGLTTNSAIDQYARSVIENDKKIRAVLENAGLARHVVASDRKLYKIWTENWQMSDDLVLFAAQKAVGATNPVQYLNKVLADYKAKGVQTVEQAEKLALTTATSVAKKQEKQHTFAQHDYTAEELNALFTDLDNLEI